MSGTTESPPFPPPTSPKTSMDVNIHKSITPPSNEPKIATVDDPNKPIVIGVYGISGSGKSTLLAQLEETLGTSKYQFVEGTAVITSFFPGPDALDHFRGLPSEQKADIRDRAIRQIAQGAVENKKISIVTGHFMFWSDKSDEGEVAWTQGDSDTYTHIVYLDLPKETLASRRQNDDNKKRGSLSEDALLKWKSLERDHLRRLCYEAGIIFTALRSPEVESVARVIDSWVNVTERANESRALEHLDGLFREVHEDRDTMDTVLLIDGDKTLTVEDTGNIFWDIASRRQIYPNANPLKDIFGGTGGYSFKSFLQAAMLYGEVEEFEALRLEVAKQVVVYPEFLEFLNHISQEGESRVKILVVTCGVARIWETILHDGYGLKNIDVLGGGRDSGGIVVTPGVKGVLVSQLQDRYGARVWAFGDSPLDLPMLTRADKAIVVVGPEETRSRSMEFALTKAIDNSRLRARQVLVGGTAHPRLDTAKLPVIRFDDQDFLYSITREVTHPANVIHLTDTPAAKLLMTATRDASKSGPDLRTAHEKIGWFLAIECLTRVIGLEDRDIPHVQGHMVKGHDLCNETGTMIVALMRGGEPMAFGVNAAFPKASFVHAKQATDLTVKHLQNQKTVVLVDSVINSGKSIVEFVKHIREIQPELQIVVVAGVVQKQAVLRGELYERLVREGEKLQIVALRLSKNKFTGKGGTDTGNRLYNTTWLE